MVSEEVKTTPLFLAQDSLHTPIFIYEKMPLEYVVIDFKGKLRMFTWVKKDIVTKEKQLINYKLQSMGMPWLMPRQTPCSLSRYPISTRGASIFTA